MRQIGQLPDEPQGRVFGDFLVARGIRNQIEREADGSVSVWIHDEDQLAAAQKWLEQFHADPKSAEFRKATAEAVRMRTAEEKDLAEYRQRIRTGRNIFPKFGGYGVGVLTYALIVVCVIVAIYSKLGTEPAVLRRVFIVDPEGATGRSLSAVFSGEVWRLFTPMFIHFGIIHLLFNMMWLYQLGCMIEGRRGSLQLAALVAVIALCSNLAQYYFAGPSFGGMSGVVYGLAGFVWMRGKYDRASGLYLDPQSVTILLVWLVVCYTGYVGPVANTAHLAGLIVGVVWGRVSAYLASGKPG